MIDFGTSVRLGPLRHSNSQRYFEARNDYRIWKWCRQNDLLTEDGHDSWLLSVQMNPKIKMYEILANIPADGEGKRPSENFTCVGVCGLTDIDQLNQRAEFSLYIFPSYQSSGYGKSALKTLIEHGFSNLNLNRIWGETFDGNPASETFKVCGFEFEGTRKDFYFRQGRFIDAHLYSIGRERWLKSAS